ncbi:hypothetical protein [Haloferax volcanii]|uniref:hypothetical protein n=1 Tax=Haloferax volcanii TaxID=2246 RepID=UPI00249CB314|nr:hypothetical protein [Haloferax alexandrinus]WEL29836.1 hypothetical protein HBNXHx_1730 [Haloferax alexandrinus]
MSTDEAQHGINVESIAKGVDGAFMRLVYISPFVLLALLLSETAREYGFPLIVAGLIVATAWAAID